MRKYLLLLLVGILAITLFTSCKKDSSGSDWYKDWLWAKTWGTTAPEESTGEPEDTTKPLELVTDPVETTSMETETTSEPTETTTEPMETTTEPMETTTEPAETTTKPAETTKTPAETTKAGGYDWWDDDPYEPSVETTEEPAETTEEPEETTAEPEPEMYIITYMLNGGKLPAGAVESFHSGMKVTLPKPTREGYTFVGWYEASNFSGNAVSEIAVGSVGNKTFYAKWNASDPGLWFPIIPLPSDRDK